MTVTIERTETAYKGWLRLLVAHMRDGDGKTFTREIEDHGRGCAVLPYDPDRRVALVVRLPRAPVLHGGETEHLIEAPAGLVEDGEDPAAAAKREALEEAGVELSALEDVGSIWSMPGISTERMALYLAPYSARERTGAGGGVEDENENITVEEIPLKELARLADANQLLDMRTLAMVQTLRIRHPALFG